MLLVTHCRASENVPPSGVFVSENVTVILNVFLGVRLHMAGVCLAVIKLSLTR